MGRPKKAQTVVSTAAETTELISLLVEQSKHRDAEPDGDSDADFLDQEQPEEVSEFEHDGVTYLRGRDNVVYDNETEEVVGRWNGSAVVSLDV